MVDAAFLYEHDKELFQLRYDILTAKEEETYLKLRLTFKANYVLCTGSHPEFLGILEKRAGYKRLYPKEKAGAIVYLFEIQ